MKSRVAVVMPVLGVTLLLLSAPALLMQFREARQEKLAYSRYEIRQVDQSEGNAVRVVGSSIWIGDRRYERWSNAQLAHLWLRDLEQGTEIFMTVEGRGGRALSEWEYRVLGTDRQGNAITDTFTFEERSRPLYRTMAARFVTPQPVGFTNDSLQQWPGLAYPVVYPWLTGLAGLVLFLGIAIARIRSDGTI